MIYQRRNGDEIQNVPLVFELSRSGKEKKFRLQLRVRLMICLQGKVLIFYFKSGKASRLLRRADVADGAASWSSWSRQGPNDAVHHRQIKSWHGQGKLLIEK